MARAVWHDDWFLLAILLLVAATAEVLLPWRQQPALLVFVPVAVALLCAAAAMVRRQRQNLLCQTATATAEHAPEASAGTIRGGAETGWPPTGAAPTGGKEGSDAEPRLARVLRGVRRLNERITSTSDRQALAQEACETLTAFLDYGKAWIVLEGTGHAAPSVGVAGLDAAEAEFAELLRDGAWPPCVARAMTAAGPIRPHSPAGECVSCPVVGCCDGTRLVARLASGGRIFGAMGVLVPAGGGIDEEEELFGELVENIAFALHKMQLAEEHQLAQEALRKSEERYHRIFENASVGIFASTLQGEILTINPAIAKALGFGTAAETVEHYHDLGAQIYRRPEQGSELLELLQREGQVHEFEWESRTPDGRDLWLSMNARVVPGRNGEEPIVEGLVIDITSRKQAEERMAESERLYRLLAENTLDCIWLMDLEGRLQYVNPASENLLGLRAEQTVGRHYSEFCDEQNGAIIRNAIGAILGALPQTKATVVEAVLRRADGGSVAVEITGRVILDEHGQPRHFQGTARDITERRRAMEEIRSRENLLNKIFDTIPAGLWLADRDGRIYRSNDEGKRIWGHPPALGVDQYGMFKARRLPGREEIGADDWAIVRTVREKATVLNELLEIDGFDGERRVILHSSAPVLGESGDVEAAVVVNLDVTELQRAQAERERLRRAIEQSQETIVVTDRDAVIQYANPAFETTTGYTRDEALGQNPRILQSGRQDAAFYADMWATIGTGKPWRGRLVNRRKDGSLYTEEATISPVLDDCGGTVSYVAVKRDISEQLRMEEERKRLEEQVERGQRLDSIGRLAGGVAHDLNNLLSPILGYAQLLEQELRHSPEWFGPVGEILRAGRRARDLVAELLAFGRRQVMEFHPVDLDQVLADFQSLLRKSIRENVAIRILTTPRLPEIRADVGKLEQIIMNLAVNAQDAMPDGGAIAIETALVELDKEAAAAHEEVEPGWYVVLSVSDTGCGMDEQTKARIFEPFFTTKGRNRGTGLGLASVYGIVKQHAGAISVGSELGKGSTFKVYLPVDRDSLVKVGECLAAPMPAGGSETILVVDDHKQVQELARIILQREGYAILTAGGGEEALRLVAESARPVDLLLADLVMPDMNGCALHERMAEMQPGLKVLYMSGYAQDAGLHQGVLDDGLDFIAKPFGVRSLAVKVREILDR